MTSKLRCLLFFSIATLTVICTCLGALAAPRVVIADGGQKGSINVELQLGKARRPPVKVSGWLREVSLGRLVIDDRVLEVEASSEAPTALEAGDYVVATAAVGEEGMLCAQLVTKLPTARQEGANYPSSLFHTAPGSPGGNIGYAFEFRGVLQEIEPRYWVVGSRLVFISDRTSIQGRPEVGVLAEVKGEVLYGGIVLGKTIRITDPDAFVEVEFEGIIEEWSPESWRVSGVDVRISAVTQIEGSPGLGMAAEILGILQPDGTVLAQRIQVKTAGYTAQVEIKGVAEEITTTHWVIAGQTVWVDSNTFVDESQAPAEVGMWAQVSALLRRDGSLLALRIRLVRYR
jgi:hypothetical protein